jgi:hypothetical protein
MIIHCEILGMQIDREAVCCASGNHPLCRKCQAQDLEEPLLLPPDGKRRSRRRCECGRIYILKGNRQRFWPKCQQLTANQKNREYQARFRKKQEVSPGVRV